MITHIVTQVKHVLNTTFDYQVTLRIVWSMFWRTVLIGAVVGAVFMLVLPRGELQTALDAVAADKTTTGLEAHMQKVEAVMDRFGYQSAAYFYFLLKQYIPLAIGSMIAARFVFRKTYRRFALKPTADTGAEQDLDWEEGMKIGIVSLLPAFILLVLQTLLSALFGANVADSGPMLLVSLAVGIFVMFFSAHLALHWHYRHFRIVVDKTQGSAA